MIENYNDYFNKAIQLKSSYETLLNQLDKVKNQREEIKLAMDNSYTLVKDYENSIEYMKKLIDVLSRKHIIHLEKLLNSAVQSIFYDKDYHIEFEISEYRNNNNLTIYLIETLEDGSEIKTDIKNNGFGLKSIIGLILQVYFIMYHKQSRILFMDESLSAISTNYIEYVRELIKSLSEKYGFIFVLVNHDPRWNDLADRVYEMKDGEIKLLS